MSRKGAPPFIKREDHVLLAGNAIFAADAPLDNPLSIAFVRSQLAAGAICEIDIEDAKQATGVAAVVQLSDLPPIGNLSVNPVMPVDHLPCFDILARGHVQFVGQPIAAVLAETVDQAEDAAGMVYADIDEDSSIPHRKIAEQSWQTGDTDTAFEKAAVVVECTINHPRLAPSPLEPRTISVSYGSQDRSVTIWHSTQTPHRTRSELATMLGIDAGRIRVIATHVGGAFGQKASLYPEEVFAVWAAFRFERDIRWIATRSEEFLSGTHGRGITGKGRLALDKAGRFLALQAEMTAPIGAWLPNSALIPAWNAARVLPSGYIVPSVDIKTTALQDGRAPMGIYRGAGRPEANMLMERLIDKAARVVECDPFELRKVNMPASDQFPLTTETNQILDSGDYHQTLKILKTKANYAKLLSDQKARRAFGELVGIGVAFYVEPSGSGWESARVTLNQDGTATIASGSSSQGHARETAYAMIASEVLGIDASDIAVTLGDTDLAPEGIGALASRSTAIGGSAVLKACADIQTQKAKGTSLPISAEVRYENDGQAWGNGAYLAQVSICRDTGVPTIERVVCVDDAGRLISPELVHGQIIGGFAQGVGEAMMEQVCYDADGQLLTGSFMDYAMPRADTVPPLEIHSLETHSPTNLLGAKGVGEAGTIGAPPALLNAVIDALSPLGVIDLQMPLTSDKIWQAMRDTETRTD